MAKSKMSFGENLSSSMFVRWLVTINHSFPPKKPFWIVILVFTVSYFHYTLFKTFDSHSWSQNKKKKISQENYTDQFLLRLEINKFPLKYHTNEFIHSFIHLFIYLGLKDFLHLRKFFRLIGFSFPFWWH